MEFECKLWAFMYFLKIHRLTCISAPEFRWRTCQQNVFLNSCRFTLCFFVCLLVCINLVFWERTSKTPCFSACSLTTETLNIYSICPFPLSSLASFLIWSFPIIYSKLLKPLILWWPAISQLVEVRNRIFWGMLWYGKC